MSIDRETPVSELGEEHIVALLRARFPAGDATVGIGDDAAVFDAPGARLLFTTDTMVESVDFDLAYFSGADLGFKALAINVSDIAAMGGTPAGAVATLCLPPRTTIGFVQDVADGIAQAADEWKVRLVGGDISGASAVSLGIALLGSVERPHLRSGAASGDAICVTGGLGGARGGLELLSRDPAASGPLVDRHRRPRARLAEAAALAPFGVTAMIDVSDGCIVDLARLVRASDVGCSVDPAAIPVDAALAEATGLDATEAALFGGEDFELLFTLPEDRVGPATDAVGAIGTRVTRIGTVTDGERLFGHARLEEMEERSWDHLRNR